ncbi:SOS response-associated peptidase family protein [Pseudomonas syringae pv. syringae]|nr:SOS response-associated peptidase family protein [Pseudomonas syringae pv. syringae]MCH5542040.1 SOS response-associated peptidase family protein [Pseudomonas syringae pv. syringae]MCH5547028.1 SOS response-associated peptidase family protein [Pseudomonas syringae pv. syringae]MCH5605574.1 SOS response-associated peptidase family protein [Pseudomonas syringae pv. syringae]MCH5610301.1 SOS response-associated peptidase family protein [Pseudomonas syringae pv. syringae]
MAPSSRVEIIRPTEEGLSVTRFGGGGSLSGQKGKRPAPINARVETVMTGKFFKGLWPNGRAVAPANGWFEWVKDPDDPKKKQPYFIRLKSKKPMFFAALAQVHRWLEPHDGDGFVIITSASDSGMVDIHDRRPVVLTSEGARAWLDSETAPQKAEALAKEHCRIVDDFEWFPVDRAVGNVRNQGPELIQPIGL